MRAALSQLVKRIISLIFDNIIVVRYLEKKTQDKVGIAALKVDIGKVYDRIE